MVDKRRVEGNVRKTSAKAWADEQDKTFEPTSVRLPEGKQFLKLRPGIIRIDVIPYIAGKGNPSADEGFIHFERTYYCYKIPMPNGRTQRYVSLWDTFGKPDPIAEWVKRNGGTADKKLLDDLRPQQRHLFNVIDVTDETERKKGIQVFDTTFGSVKWPSFGKMLKDKIQMSKKFDDFADPENGLTIVLKVEEDSFPGGKFCRVTALEFDERDRQYDQDIVNDAVCLDDALIEMPYDELKRIFLQEPPTVSNGNKTVSSNGNSEETSAAGRTRPPSESRRTDASGAGKTQTSAGAGKPSKVEAKEGTKDPTAEDLNLSVGDKVVYDGKNYMIMVISGDGTSLTLAGIDDDSRKRGVAPSEVKSVAVKDDEDPEDSWGDDDEDEESEGEDDGGWDEEEEEEEDLPVRKRKRK